MHRHDVRQLAGCWVVGIAVLSWAEEAAGADRPNVVVIFADDLGWGDLGCFGNEKFKTPRIDRMAKEGARLTSFYSCAPYCAPSRSGLQTGRYQVRTGVVRNPTPDRGINTLGLPPSEITLAEALSEEGYATIHVGKWHLGHLPKFHPMEQGYDQYFGILYSNDMNPVELWEGRRVIEYPVIQASLTKRYTERTLSFIERNRDRPFFVYLAHAMPHKPLAASEGFYQKSGTGLYGDVMAELDWSVGQILDKLKVLGLDEKTIVYFTSDNGPWYGGSSGGLRGMKGRTWEGGIRVPLIARWPGKIPKGHESDEPTMTLDLFTTSIKLCGGTVPTDRVIDGKDIWGVLTSDAKSPHESLLSFKGGELKTIRSGKWKLHVSPPGAKREKVWKPEDEWVDPRRPDGVRIIAPYEQPHISEFPGLMTGDVYEGGALFDLEKDAAEQHNVMKEHPEVVKRLKTMVAAYRESFESG